MIQILKAVFNRFLKKKAINIFEISKNKPVFKENENTFVTDHSIVLEAKEVKQQFKCRICLDQGETPESAVCMPCKCSGSMKYVHVECLQAWIIQKKSLKCEICNYDYSIKWFTWAAQHNILENGAQKKAQQNNNNNNNNNNINSVANQRRQQIQNEQNRVRQQQNLLRSFGQRKSLSALQKVQCLLLLAGIIVSFVFAYSSNTNSDWESSKQSNQHKRVFFTSLIVYCFTMIVAYFWISQSKGFEYTFETNLTYFKSHLPSLQNNNLINLQQQQSHEHNSNNNDQLNSEMDIESQQRNNELPAAPNSAQFPIDVQQQNEHQIGEIVINLQHENQNQEIEQAQNVDIESQVSQQQNCIQGAEGQEMTKIPNANDKNRDQSDINAKQTGINSLQCDRPVTIIAQQEKNLEKIDDLNEEIDQQPKTRDIQSDEVDTNQLILITLKDGSTEEKQVREVDNLQENTIGDLQNGAFNLIIDEKKEIILFCESDSNDERLSQQQNKTFEIGKIQSNTINSISHQISPIAESKIQQKEEDENENIPSTTRGNESSHKGAPFQINSSAVNFKKKNNNSYTWREYQGTSTSLQYETNTQKNDTTTYFQNIEYPRIIVHTDDEIITYYENQQTQTITQFAADQMNQNNQKQTEAVFEPTNANIMDIQQSQQINEEQQVGLIKFDSSESLNDEQLNDSSTVVSKINEQMLEGIQFQFIYAREEDVVSPKQHPIHKQQSLRKDNHNGEKNSEWNSYLNSNVPSEKFQEKCQDEQDVREATPKEQNREQNVII